MEIIATEKKTSWTDRLFAMEVGESMNIDLKACKTVSQTISFVKGRNPERGWNWTVKKMKVEGINHHGQVTRLA